MKILAIIGSLRSEPHTRDLVVYGRLLKAQHDADLDRARAGEDAGMANWHVQG